MPDPIRVLYLDHTAKLSGGEIALLRLLQALDRSVVEPVVVLGENGPLEPKMREAGIEVHVLELDAEVREIRKGTLGAAGIRHLVRVPRLLGYARRIARFASDRQVNVIHTNSLKSDIYGAFAAKMAGLPVVWHIRDGIHSGYLPKPAVFVFRWLARTLPDYVVANSSATLESLRLGAKARKDVIFSGGPVRTGKNTLPTMVLYDGVHTKTFGRRTIETQRTLNPVGAISERPIIGIVGRIAPWKGQDVFLQAAETVLQRGYAGLFWIVGSALFGEADFEQQLRRRAGSGILQGKVQFLGFREDMEDILGELDILVHASTVPEPFGQVIIEGMAAGLPVIASDAGGPREIITHGVSGLLSPPGDAVALAEAIIELLENPGQARAIAQAGRRHVEQHFSVRSSAEKVERIYREIATNRIHQRESRARRSERSGSDRLK
ncbi:MAG: putative glycosyl transferase [Armatimonadota bacterium]|nr:MAG: putative glycosyl transferase [Armatimonadota bacterium]